VNSNTLQFLGLVKKAGAIVYGDALMEAIRTKSVYVVLLSDRASERTKKQIKNKCAFYQIKLFEDVPGEAFTSIRGKTVAALGVDNRKMASKIVRDEKR
jgi:hypothetical protein